MDKGRLNSGSSRKLTIHAFIHQIFIASYYVPDIVLGTGDTVNDVKKKSELLWGLQAW